MNIALVSLDQLWEDKDANLRQCEAYIKKASDKVVELIIFPEMTLTGFSMNTAAIGEYEEKSNTIQYFQQLARTYHIAIIFGVVFNDDAKATNNLIFVAKDGAVNLQYKKIHPFTFSGEDKIYKGGNIPGLCQFGDLTIGVTICYDLRFPELYTALGKTCDFVVNIANWPKKRVDHWRTLLKARAIENQIFCIGVNRTGIDGNNLEYEESSLVYNANGEALSPVQSYQQMAIYNVDVNWNKTFCANFSTTQDRKVALYKKIM